MIVLPKAGQLKSMNERLETLLGDGQILKTLDTVTRQYDKDTSGVLALVTAMELAIILILCLCAGFLSYIQFYVRRGEFAMLLSIGYTQPEMLKKAFLQIAAMNAAGFILGLALSFLAICLLSALFFVKTGAPLPVPYADALVRAACAPVLTLVACLIPSWRVIVSLDPAMLLEGRG
jgi:ABC-type antimicrobial peptide transport system permease subunit